MKKKSIVDLFERIELPDPTDLVIAQIQSLIAADDLGPGDRLPSEKRLEERMGLPRGVISKALKRLETYGIVNTVPQSGTYIADFAKEVLDGLLTNVVRLNETDFTALTDLRCMLEEFAVSLVIDRATDAEIALIGEAQASLADRVARNDAQYDHDILFHLRILQYARNPVLTSIVTKLCVQTLEILKTCEKEYGYEFVQNRLEEAVNEHEAIIAALRSRNRTAAVEAVRRHFELSKQYLTAATT